MRGEMCYIEITQGAGSTVTDGAALHEPGYEENTEELIGYSR